MNYVEFIERAGERARVSPDRAADFASATLRTLAERLTGGEARDLAAQLPKPLQPALQKRGESAEAFQLDQFVRRVSERTGMADPARARDVVQAVLVTLREAVTGGEFDDVMAQLPKEFREVASGGQGRR